MVGISKRSGERKLTIGVSTMPYRNSWRCSECRRENYFAYDETSQRFTDFYCPNCGAKMDKENDNADS